MEQDRLEQVGMLVTFISFDWRENRKIQTSVGEEEKTFAQRLNEHG